jgi:hypothetical protein
LRGRNPPVFNLRKNIMALYTVLKEFTDTKNARRLIGETVDLDNDLGSKLSQSGYVVEVDPSQRVITGLEERVGVIEAVYPPAIARVANLEGSVSSLVLNEVAESSSVEFDKTADGAADILPARAVARTVQIVVQVTEEFADGSGQQPMFNIGDETSAAKFLIDTELQGATAGKKIPCGGVIDAGEKLVVTATAGTGTSTGAIRVTSIATA